MLRDSLGTHIDSVFVRNYSVVYYRVGTGVGDNQIFALFRPKKPRRQTASAPMHLDGPGLIRTGPFLIAKVKGSFQPVTLPAPNPKQVGISKP
jgi:hypothetical protein